jgi:hypothetical protein
MTLQLPIEEYFKYHPPTTPERIALHERVNQKSLEICKMFIAAKNITEILATRDAAKLLAEDVCGDLACLDWARDTIDDAAKSASVSLDPIDWQEHREISILMHVQQFRMFLNQGITIDSLTQLTPVFNRTSVFTDGLGRTIVKLTEADTTAKIDHLTQECEKDLRSSAQLKNIYNPAEISKAIVLTLDGDKWCAAVGENLQTGTAGFGSDPIAALSDLYANLKGIEFQELKDSNGKIYSTSIRSIAHDSEALDKYRDFIDAYGEAISDREANGLSDRERLIADLAATEEDEEIGGM